MMDLIGGYLLVILVLFSANTALLLGNYRIDNIRLILISLAFAVGTLILLNASLYLNSTLSFLLEYFSYVFLAIGLIIFIVMFFFVKNSEFKLSLYLILPTFLIAVILFASQSSLSFFEMILYSLLVFFILFVFY